MRTRPSLALTLLLVGLAGCVRSGSAQPPSARVADTDGARAATRNTAVDAPVPPENAPIAQPVPVLGR